jgi:hypothetical protein
MSTSARRSEQTPLLTESAVPARGRLTRLPLWDIAIGDRADYLLKCLDSMQTAQFLVDRFLDSFAPLALTDPRIDIAQQLVWHHHVRSAPPCGQGHWLLLH